jgi:uncharacterized protein
MRPERTDGNALRRAVLSVLRIALLVWLLVLAGVYVFQSRLLYVTEPASVAGTIAATSLPSAMAWPGKADFRGVRVDPSGATVGTLLLFHGNAGHAGHRGDYAERLAPLGWRVILIEYPGFGARAGTPGEKVFTSDAVESVALARREFGGRIVLAGESLGAGVAAAAVAAIRARGETIDGLLLITPWDELANAAAYHYPWLPVRLLLDDRYDSVSNLRGFGGPTVVVVARDDDLVPVRLGQALYDGIGGRKAMLTVDAAGHNDWFDRVDAAWWKRVGDLLDGPGPAGT